MSENNSLPLDDYPSNHPSINNVVAFLNGNDVISIPRKSLGEAGSCYWNVHRQILSHGGSMLLGWMLEWSPGLVVEAMHHAVHKQENGDIVDVTSPDGIRSSSKTTFVPSVEIPIDLNTCPMIPRRHYPLVKDNDLTRYIYLYRKNHQAKIDLTNGLLSAGLAKIHEGQCINIGGIPIYLEKN